MTDLINKINGLVKNDVDSVQAIVNKYTSVLQGTLPEKNIPYLAVIINTCVHHLNDKHKDLDADWKAWSVLLIKKLFEDNKLKKEEDIHLVIEEFLEYKEKEYEKYCKNIISVTEYDRDRGFLYKFYWKKNR